MYLNLCFIYGEGWVGLDSCVYLVAACKYFCGVHLLTNSTDGWDHLPKTGGGIFFKGFLRCQCYSNTVVTEWYIPASLNEADQHISLPSF